MLRIEYNIHVQWIDIEQMQYLGFSTQCYKNIIEGCRSVWTSKMGGRGKHYKGLRTAVNILPLSKFLPSAALNVFVLFHTLYIKYLATLYCYLQYSNVRFQFFYKVLMHNVQNSQTLCQE